MCVQVFLSLFPSWFVGKRANGYFHAVSMYDEFVFFELEVVAAVAVVIKFRFYHRL
jgi:hypothetical protein